MKTFTQIGPKQEFRSGVHCPICTHTVQAEVVMTRKAAYVKPGQKCPRCSTRLDAGYVLAFDRAA